MLLLGTWGDPCSNAILCLPQNPWKLNDGVPVSSHFGSLSCFNFSVFLLLLLLLFVCFSLLKQMTSNSLPCQTIDAQHNIQQVEMIPKCWLNGKFLKTTFTDVNFYNVR